MGLTNRLLEQDREVVDYSITSTHLLHELAAHAKHHTSEMLRLPTREDGFERRAFSACVA